MLRLNVLLQAGEEAGRRVSRTRGQGSLDWQNMSDELFAKHFRFDKPTFALLCEDLQNLTDLQKTCRLFPLEIKVLCALSFLSTGSYQRIVGGFFQVTQRTVSRFVCEVTEALNHDSMANKWIQFPSRREERIQVMSQFQTTYHMPGVIGCIDCTHISIICPKANEHLYFNRKGYHSLNVQMICDKNLTIFNVFANFGGATHDSYIWNSSSVEPFMRYLHGQGESAWLLGDSGYGQRPWMMIPILDAPPGSREEVYTQRHVRSRNCIERCFGLLKARWRCLLKHRTLHYEPSVARRITIACCVLHNIAIAARLPEPEMEDHDGVEELQSNIFSEPINNQNALSQGRAIRDMLVARM